MLKKWLYSVFLVLLFFGVGQSFAFEKEARGTELVDSWKKLDELGPDIPSAISFDLRIETKKLDELGSLISTVKQKFALTGIPPSWFDDLSEALLQKLKGIPSNQIDDFAGDLNAIENAIKQKPELVDSWKLLDEANSPLKTNIDELTKVTNNIDDVRDLGYTIWKKIDDLDLSDAFTHVKIRKTAPRRKGIVGCHDKTAFFDQDVIRSVDASGNPSYTPQIGKTADQVEEIVITSKVPHSQVPGVEVVEYKIPSLSNSNPPLTTGQLKPPSNGGVKTIYDPAIWTDSKLQKAVDEAILDYAKKNGDLLEGQALIGKTLDGYDIEFFYRNGTVETFYFR